VTSNGGSHLSQHEQKIGERHRLLLRALHRLGSHSYLGQVYVHRLGQEMGMNTVGLQDAREELAKLARELEEAGYIQGGAGGYAFYKETKREPPQLESMKEAYGYYALTDEGRRRIEEEENQG
jgi:hypothetical protein